MTEYYASPNGSGSGLSETDPFLIADAWLYIRPGDTLWLLDGVYRGINSMIQPAYGFAGTPDARIAIRAINDGKVLIDGESLQQRPVWLDYARGNDYFEVEGINAANGLNYVIDASSKGNIFRRCIAWNAIESDEGEQTWRSNGYNTLVEDCVAFGGRYALGCNQMGNDAPDDPMTTFRRCLVVYTEATETSPKASIVYWYNSDPCRWENCIAIWNAEEAPNSQGLFYCATADPYVHGAWQTELLGCIAVLKASAGAPAAISGFSAQGNRRITIKNCLAAMSPGNPAPNLLPFDLRAASKTQSGDEDLYVIDCTGLGANPSSIHSDWNVMNVKEGPSVAAVYGDQSLYVNDGNRGATIGKRYEDGVLTDKGLWPWPMNQRIIDAMAAAGRTPVDVTAELEAIFGPVPDSCRWDIGSNPEPGNGGEPDVISIAAIPGSVGPGGDVVAEWMGSKSAKDWIGLHLVGAGDDDYIDWQYVNGTTHPTDPVPSGAIAFTMPAALGSYEFRFFENDGSTSVVKSNQITVHNNPGNPGPQPPTAEDWVEVPAWIRRSNVPPE